MSTPYTGPVSIYLRLLDFNNKPVSTDGSAVGSIDFANGNNQFDANNPQFIKVLSYANSIEQTLNMSSQSTGAGAGKVAFNPLAITKYMDAASAVLFRSAATGTAYKTAEILFVTAQNAIILKHTYKLVAVKTISWSADGGSGVVENVSFEYGGQFVTINKQAPDGKISIAAEVGWNRIKNVLDTDITSVIAKA